MAGNRIYRGPADRQPKTVTDKTVAGAYLPGTFVVESASALTQVTAPGPMVRLLSNRDSYDVGQLTATDPMLLAYASGDTGMAYVLEPGQEYQGAVAAATYTYGQELTISTAGRLAAASSGNIVVGFANEAGAKSAGALIDWEVANFYTKA
jgi:hypothetical protein